jgi:extracellular elastinolytic metalloproteinase
MVPCISSSYTALVLIFQFSHPKLTITQFEVEMENNWYEATVSASLPHRIVSVVDWASDSPMPLYSPESHHEDAQLPPLSSFLPADSSAPSCSSKKTGRFRMGKAVAELRKSKAAKEAAKWFSSPSIPVFPIAYYNVFPWGTNDPIEAVERKAMEEDGKFRCVPLVIETSTRLL